MNDLSIRGLWLLGLVSLLVPLTYGAAAVSASDPVQAHWPRARFAAAVAFAISLVVALSWGLTTQGQPLVLSPSSGAHALELSVRLDVVTSVMLVLVSFIALVIVRYSRTYLDGDDGQGRYVRWLMATLAAVTLLIVSNNLLVLALAWMGTSLALHQLLTFYADRTQALVAAHKKFLVSRVADVCLVSAIAMVGMQAGSFELDRVYAWAESQQALPTVVHVATVLFVVGASLKCAQLPFHGWLTQVMEAPTPVSALLHAGVVNIGGLLMIRLAPLMAKADFAQTLLVVIGTLTAVLAALVMTTRISIKVMLAWSTIAQMGFMLVQCGLGAYQLALLHLVAHSCYKAHAFLSSGSAVEQWRSYTLVKSEARSGLFAWALAAVVGSGAVTVTAALFGASPSSEPALWALSLVLSLALTPLLVRGAQLGVRGLVSVGVGSVMVAGLYFLWHGIATQLLTVPAQSEQLAVRIGLVIAAFVALFAVQALLATRPQGQLARALYPRLFAGLYLDELFTRLTFHVWPPRLPPRDERTDAVPMLEIVEG